MPFVFDRNKVLTTPIIDIVNAIKLQSSLDGNYLLKDVEVRQQNIVVTCPIHKGGHENKPACNILAVDKGNSPAGTVHCFSCGYRANIIKFTADCLGMSYRKATEWLLGFCDYSILEEQRDIGGIEFSEKGTDPYSEIQTVGIDELKKYDYIHPYMFERKLTDYTIEKFEIGYDPETESITFPVYVDGRCLFVARRKVNYKRFDLPKISPKPLYLADYLTENEVYICESCFNALTVWEYGKQAIALFGTGSHEQIDMLKKLPQRKLILALDGDEAGENGCKRISGGIDNKIVTRLVLPDGKDINDLTREEFYSLEETFI